MYVTKDKINSYIDMLSNFFDKVRIVDVSLTKEINVNAQCDFENEYKCYAVWNKDNRCDNCISAKALKLKESVTKFEFVDNDVYFVMAEYLVLDGEECVLEMVKKLDSKTMFGAYGRKEFVEKIKDYNKKLYQDTLTEVYNRRFLSEQLKQFKYVNFVALIDIDDFKIVNDKFGHIVGDELLKNIAKILKDNIKKSDSIIRVGGDEFLLIFQDIDKNIIEKRLEQIRKSVQNLKIDKVKDVNISISIGGVFGNDAINNIELADKALYKAKENKNDFIIEYI